MNNSETSKTVGFTVLGIMLLFLTFTLGYTSALDTTNESCIKTGHFYVMDNVFTCELEKSE